MVVTGTRRVGSDSERDAEDYLQQLHVNVRELKDKITIRTDQPKKSHGRSYMVDYEITIPRFLDLSIGHINGNIKLHGLTGSTAVQLINGNVRLDHFSGTVEVDLTNGNVAGDVTLISNNSIDLSVTNGNIDLDIPEQTSADLMAMVTNGSIHTNNLQFNDLNFAGRSLEGTLGTGMGQIDLRTVNGNIIINGYEQ